MRVPLPPRSHAPLSLLVLIALCFAPLARGAYPAEKEKKPNKQVVKYVGHKEKVQYQGKLVMVLAVEPLSGSSRPMELIVKNHDMNKGEYDPVLNTDNVNAPQKGEAVKIELDDSKPRPMVTYLKKYDLKPGESDPRAYRFMSTYRKGEVRRSLTRPWCSTSSTSRRRWRPVQKSKRRIERDRRGRDGRQRRRSAAGRPEARGTGRSRDPRGRACPRAGQPGALRPAADRQVRQAVRGRDGRRAEGLRR